MGKVDAKRDKKLVDEYMRHLEDKVKTGEDVAEIRITGVLALHAMLKKVFDSSASDEARSFWIKNLNVFNKTLDFVAVLHTENTEINSYNEYNYALNQKIAEKLKEAEEKIDRLTKILEEKYQ